MFQFKTLQFAAKRQDVKIQQKKIEITKKNKEFSENNSKLKEIVNYSKIIRQAEIRNREVINKNIQMQNGKIEVYSRKFLQQKQDFLIFTSFINTVISHKFSEINKVNNQIHSQVAKLLAENQQFKNQQDEINKKLIIQKKILVMKEESYDTNDYEDIIGYRKQKFQDCNL